MKVFCAVGLGYGDEGKGTITDALCRKHNAGTVVRFNGGAQASHHVVLDDGRFHGFSQFGSGTFAGARTHLSRFMLVNPIFMDPEAKHLETVGVPDPYSLVTVERGALITTPYHVSINRLREMSRDARHGSCGMGIGETMADSLAFPDDAIYVGDIEDPARLRAKLERLRSRKIDEGLALCSAGNPFVKGATAQNNEAVMREWGILTDHTMTALIVERFQSWARRAAIVDEKHLHEILRKETVIFEGAQGVLLDQDFGWQPYTTWTDTTFGNAMKLLEGYTGEVTRLGITRAYMTRHGAGPFVTEDKEYDQLSANDHNALGPWQGNFRSGALDLVALRYALDVVGGVDSLVITHLDRISLASEFVDGSWWTPVCWAYDPPPDGCGLNVKRPVDLDRQAMLAELLFKAQPRISRLRCGTELHFARQVAELLGVPLTITSNGPRPQDKEFFSVREQDV